MPTCPHLKRVAACNMARLAIVKIMGVQTIEVQPNIVHYKAIVKVMGVQTIEVQPKRVQ